ncbi:MAG: ATP-binding protein, partial [Candidatus Pacebacteria bacterium]|nr:ATP-binding protein [Candidatus Paceibacterota bacterium]
INLSAERALRNGVKIYRHELDVQLMADPGRLSIAFFNIIANSIDSMHNGGTVEIKCLLEKDLVEIQFIDTGIGIPVEFQSRVFYPFVSTKAKGFGLGLALTKRIIEKDHNGKVTIMSLPSKGTTVNVLIPTNVKIKKD